MNLYAKLLEREAAGRPVTVGLIGAGKFGTMFLTQVRRTRGMHVVGVADLDVDAAREPARAAGWDGGSLCRVLARRRAQDPRAPMSPTMPTR